ncbi:MAG TPA: ABC transporter substrate-binding protein [Firmicutes bacterium]|nr:ABC transporter substrate-binding protein [Candidatus Fermentithermobacillaceae bacterium]
MKRLSLLLTVLALVLSMVLAISGCGRKEAQKPPETSIGEPGPSAPATGKKLSDFIEPLDPPVKVTVGLKQVISDSGVLIGVAKNYYKDLGIEIEMTQFATGQDMINALAAGQLDVGCTVTASGLFNAMIRGLPVKVVADKGINVPDMGYYRLVIRSDLKDTIKDFTDLKGRKLAIVGTASLDEIALDRCLNAGGLTLEDVDVQVIRSFPDIIAAMSNGSIDGGMVIEPFVTQAIELGIADPWKDPKEYDPDAQTALLVYGKSILERPEVAKRFMVAYIQALRDYNDAFFHDKGKDEIIDILVKYSTVTDKALYDKMYPTGLNPDGYVRMKGVQMDLDWYKARGLLMGDLTAEQAVDNSYVDFALSVLGKYGE